MLVLFAERQGQYQHLRQVVLAHALCQCANFCERWLKIILACEPQEFHPTLNQDGRTNLTPQTELQQRKMSDHAILIYVCSVVRFFGVGGDLFI